MLGASEIQESLITFLRKRCEVDEVIDADTDLLAHGVLDSMLVMDLIVLIEKQVNIRLDDGDIAPKHFRTPGRLAAFIASKRNGQRTEERA